MTTADGECYWKPDVGFAVDCFCFWQALLCVRSAVQDRTPNHLVRCLRKMKSRRWRIRQRIMSRSSCDKDTYSISLHNFVALRCDESVNMSFWILL